MAVNKFIPNSSTTDFIKLCLQRESVLKKYEFLKVISQNTKEIIFVGALQPNGCNSYLIKIVCRANSSPKVFIKSPEIPYNSVIHMYSDKSLCLFYPKEMPWNNSKLIADTIIPWTVEWLIFYELWLETGKWLAPSVSHGNKK